jgi:hypothetical protein
MRVLVGSITGSSFIQGNVKLAFYCLLAGGILDFILQCLPPGEPQAPATVSPVTVTPVVAIIALLMAFFISSCSIIKPEVDHSKTDTTITTYKQVDLKVKGAKVFAGINMDSLFHAALIEKVQQRADSISKLKLELQYKQDSIAALKANKPIPAKPIYIISDPVKQYVTDPQTKAQLTYWIDAYGKFQITCESKDQTIASLQAQVTKLTKDTTVTTKVAYQTPVWNKVVMIIEGLLLITAILIIVFKSII